MTIIYDVNENSSLNHSVLTPMLNVGLIEPKEIINDCQNKAQSFRKKYGTVFNYENSKSRYSPLIDIVILLLPLIFLYYLYKRKFH